MLQIVERMDTKDALVEISKVLKVLFQPCSRGVVTFGALWSTNRAVTLKQATCDDGLTEVKAGGYKIITTEELPER